MLEYELYNSFIKSLIYSNWSHWEHAIYQAKSSHGEYKEHSRAHKIHQVLKANLYWKKMTLSPVYWINSGNNLWSSAMFELGDIKIKEHV